MKPLSQELKKSISRSLAFGTVAFILLLVLEKSITSALSSLYLSIKTELNIGMFVAILTLMIDLLKDFDHRHTTTSSEVKETIDKSNSKVVDLVKIHNNFFTDEELFNQLKLLAHSKENISEKGNLTQKYFSETFNNYVETIHKVSEGEVLKLNNEFERIYKLNEVMKEATTSVYAVTYDTENYFETFWGDNLLKDYIVLNQKIAEKVKIHRIFVFEENELKFNEKKSKKLKKICEELKDFPNIETKIILMSNAQKVDRASTSFIIIDDEVASESKGNGNLRGKRYLSLSNSEIVNALKSRFWLLYNSTDSYNFIG